MICSVLDLTRSILVLDYPACRGLTKERNINLGRDFSIAESHLFFDLSGYFELSGFLLWGVNYRISFLISAGIL